MPRKHTSLLFTLIFALSLALLLWWAVFAFVATLVFVSGSAVIHIGGSPEGEPWWRAAVVLLTAVVLVHSAVTGASRAAPSRAALRVEGA